MYKALGFQLVQEQTQKVIMTKELRQSITVLQYSSADLIDFIQKQTEENPLLEIEWKEQRLSAHKHKESIYLPQDTIGKSTETLETYLLEQLHVLSLAPLYKSIARYMIGLLDSNGYFRENVEAIAKELNCSVTDIEAVLQIIQGFEPSGVGARNLQECLLIQLRASGNKNTRVEQVIQSYLEDLANHRYTLIAKELGISLQEVEEITAVIKELQPKPGNRFGMEQIRYIIPDVYVELIGDELVITANGSLIPRITVNPYYQQLLEDPNSPLETKAYIEERVKKGVWLIRSLEERRKTIVKVTEEIFRHQIQFLREGTSGIRPLTLQDIAEKVQVHESTVSRATNQKYVQTALGLHELKYFFVNGLATITGESTSNYEVKAKIRKIIEEEDKHKPYSDQKIANLLKLEGIQISRRTVVKYREAMRIPSSTKRRRFS